MDDGNMNNIRQDAQVPDWLNLEIFLYDLPDCDNIEIAGEGLFNATIGDLTSFVIRFKDPRFYTENVQIRILEETSEDVVLDVVPFEVAKGYGIRAFYMLTQPGRVRLDITIDGVPIPRITVGVDVNYDYVHSLEVSNRTLLRLFNQQRDRERLASEELQAVMNELNMLLAELPNVCQAAMQSINSATERTTAAVNRAQRLIQQYPQPPGPAPPVSPRGQQGDQGPRDVSPPARNGSPPAPSVPVAVGPSPPEVRRQIPLRRASTTSLHSERREPGVTRKEGRQPDGLKRKPDDDMGEEEPAKRGRWSAPSAIARAEDRVASPIASNGNTSPRSSGSTDVIQQLNDLLDSVIQRGRDEAPTQDRASDPNEEEVSWRLQMTPSPIERPFSAPGRMEGLEKSWSLRFSLSPTPTDYENRAPPQNGEEEDDPFQCNQLGGLETVSNIETISSTVSQSSSCFKSVASAVSQKSAPSNTSAQGSPCPSLVSSGRSSRRSQEGAPSDASVQGSPGPSLSSSRRSSTSRCSRVSSVGAIRGSPCPSSSTSCPSSSTSCPSSSSSDSSSSDEKDSPRRNPRYNPYYWMRPIARKNYRELCT